MNGIMPPAPVWLLLAFLAPALACAETAYEWTDAAGETHYGYRPPQGVVGTPLADEERKLYSTGNPVNCRDLREEHLRLIDKEIARLKKLPVGLGPDFEFTAESRQRFVNELMAHRAALLTGRKAEEFLEPDRKRELSELKQKYLQERARMQESLEEQAQQLKQQGIEMNRQRQFNRAIYPPYPYLHPGQPY